jgi:CRISPR-associated endonuclease/helicase Cas3
MEPSWGSIDFAPGFQALTGGLTPLHWQARLFAEFKSGRVPVACTLPTGLGKTSVIPIWLIALASGAELPRRLVYIVNRRTVVDQATDVVAEIRERLLRPDDARWAEQREALKSLAGRLGRLSRCETGHAPLAVSTLRGELADNGEWKENPACPVIIVGTIDMIGSKLVFSGYGDGRHGRAQHAGLIGQDALIVHDEAHLSPAFDALLDAVTREQARTREASAIRVMRLSATERGSGVGATAGTAVFGIEDEDRNDSVVRERLSARKCLEIVEADKGKDADPIAVKALECGAGNARVLVYVRSPETAQSVRERIINGLKQRAKDASIAMTDEEAAGRVGLLTGTIRGHERDQLAWSALFRAFQSKADGAAPGG